MSGNGKQTARSRSKRGSGGVEGGSRGSGVRAYEGDPGAEETNDSGQCVKLSVALSSTIAQLAEAERDIKCMQEDGLDEHPVEPGAEFSQALIRSFLENKRQFDESSLEVRRLKQNLLELRASARQGTGMEEEMRYSSVTHYVFLYHSLCIHVTHYVGGFRRAWSPQNNLWSSTRVYSTDRCQQASGSQGTEDL